MSKKSKARARKRRAVDRTERVKPSALAEAKKRPWIMQTLLQRGPEQLGTTAEQHEAGIEIAEAFTALTRSVGWRNGQLNGLNITSTATALDTLSPRDERLITVYQRWASELILRFRLRAAVVVEWITNERELHCSGVPHLVHALDLWTKHRDEWRPPDRAPVLTTPPRQVLTVPAAIHARSAAPAIQQSAPRHAAAPTNAPRAVAQARIVTRGRASSTAR